VAITNHRVVETPKEVDALVYGVEGPEILIDALRGKAAYAFWLSVPVGRCGLLLMKHHICQCCK
jgi:hypothetical protein